MQGLIFAPKFTRFSNCTTIGDVMRQLYGVHSQVMTGVLAFFTALCIAGMELTVIGILCEALLGIDFRWGVIMGGAMLVIYTTYGGIKSVALTDLFQGLVLLIVLPIITVAALKQAGGIEAVLTRVPAEQFRLITHPQAPYYTALFLSLSVFQFSVIDPALVQRILMGKSRRQLRYQFCILAACLIAVMVAVALLGLSSIVLYPNIESGVAVVPHMITHVLPTGIRGLAMAGILAITMATFDSFLHAAGLTLIHDVINPISLRMGRNINELKWVRYATLGMGSVVIGVGLIRADELYGLVLLSYKFTGPLLAFPLFAGVCGLKPDRRSFYVASAVTAVVLLLAEQLLPEKQNHWVPIISVVTNGICFLGMHAAQNRGFVVCDTREDKIYLWKPQRKILLGGLKGWIPTPQRIVQYSQRQVIQYGASYVLFSLFCCINYLFPYFMWEHSAANTYDLMLYLRFLGALLCGLILVKDKWPDACLPYLPTFWHLTLLYCLPFVSTVMFLLTAGSVEWLINVAITIMFLIVLVDWVSFVILAILGVSLGVLFYQIAVGPINLQLDFSTGYLLVYTCTFATIIALLFARRKQQHLEAKLREISRHYHNMRSTATADTPPAVYRIASMIERSVLEANRNYHNATKTIPMCPTDRDETEDYTGVDYLGHFFPTALTVIQQGELIYRQIETEISNHYIKPQSTQLSIKSCINTVIKAYYVRYKRLVQVDYLADYLVRASMQHLKYTITHILQFLHSLAEKAHIRLWVTPQENIHLRLVGRAVAVSLIRDLCVLFPVKERTKHLGLAISQLLVAAHGGHLWYEARSHTTIPYTEFVIALPAAEEAAVGTG